jgi:[NiFe] hydrogenase small subunit
MKFCTGVAVAMGMGPAFAPKVAEVLTSKNKPSVVWLHGAECTGCSESLLRAVDPYVDELILDILSVDYHETIMAAAGEAAEAALHKATEKPKSYVCVVEGGIPTVEDGAWLKVSGHTFLDTCKKIVPNALATICIGNCACFGGVQAAKPNPSKAMGVNEALKSYGVKAISVAGCPPNPYNFVGTVVHFLTKGLPELDEYNRPIPFYGEAVHDNCPRLKHFEAGEFAPSFDSEEAKKGWCLYELGCKGPSTMNNCPKVLFNQTSWPVQAGHPCIGCSEPHFWDEMSPFYQS